ncbi:MAG: sigma-70 family RNA polymerase sigma factor [Bacteroidales bacterium]|nr:sigma-70 family RNA polymerase sigma factor [Bacteroidales bacterium]MBN2819376.1 sigma-70 family RNA polymerase sigma factor [Bacteroidales bacterium]
MEVAYQDIHRDIVELSKAGNRKAQYQLYRLYSKAMFNICYRMLNSFEEAEDLLQEAFTDAFNKLESFRYESSFGAWLKRIVVNKCINHVKKRKADLVITDDLPENPNQDDSTDFDTVEMEVKKVHKAMELLPEGYRVIFSLYLIEGYDHSEIAEIMGITESTSKSQFSRAKVKIKELIKTL